MRFFLDQCVARSLLVFSLLLSCGRSRMCWTRKLARAPLSGPSRMILLERLLIQNPILVFLVSWCCLYTFPSQSPVFASLIHFFCLLAEENFWFIRRISSRCFAPYESLEPINLAIIARASGHRQGDFSQEIFLTFARPAKKRKRKFLSWFAKK